MTVFYIHHDIVHLIPQNSLQYDLQPIVSKVRAFRWMEEKLYYISLVSVNFFPVLMGICSLIPCFFPIFMGICIMISYDKFCKNFESKRRDEAMVYFNEGINFISNEHFLPFQKKLEWFADFYIIIVIEITMIDTMTCGIILCKKFIFNLGTFISVYVSGLF